MSRRTQPPSAACTLDEMGNGSSRCISSRPRAAGREPIIPRLRRARSAVKSRTGAQLARVLLAAHPRCEASTRIARRPPRARGTDEENRGTVCDAPMRPVRASEIPRWPLVVYQPEQPHTDCTAARCRDHRARGTRSERNRRARRNGRVSLPAQLAPSTSSSCWTTSSS